MHKKYYRKVCT